ncbi:MAG TPA: hypothetical protein VII57_05975 [Dehalococcoidia bacterium]|nr:hypothetical protein [Dehalococcoidia bacterium]
MERVLALAFLLLLLALSARQQFTAAAPQEPFLEIPAYGACMVSNSTGELRVEYCEPR